MAGSISKIQKTIVDGATNMEEAFVKAQTSSAKMAATSAKGMSDDANVAASVLGQSKQSISSNSAINVKGGWDADQARRKSNEYANHVKDIQSSKSAIKDNLAKHDKSVADNIASQNMGQNIRENLSRRAEQEEAEAITKMKQQASELSGSSASGEKAKAELTGSYSDERPGKLTRGKAGNYKVGEAEKRVGRSGDLLGDAKEGFSNFIDEHAGPETKAKWNGSNAKSEEAKNLRQAAAEAKGNTKTRLLNQADKLKNEADLDKLSAGFGWLTGEGSFTTGVVRIGGPIAALDVLGRVTGPGTLTTDANGNQNIAGIPFI